MGSTSVTSSTGHKVNPNTGGPVQIPSDQVTVLRVNKSVEDEIDAQLALKHKPTGKQHLKPVSHDELENYLRTDSDLSNQKERYQHLDVHSRSGLTAKQINDFIDQWAATHTGDFIIRGMGQAYIDAETDEKGNVQANAAFLLASTLAESGGTRRYGEKDGVYSLYGWNAYNTDPNQQFDPSSKSAGRSVEEAIKKGATAMYEGYISKGQNTVYKMRWDPLNSGDKKHQYATAIDWASARSERMNDIFESAKNDEIYEKQRFELIQYTNTKK